MGRSPLGLPKTLPPEMRAALKENAAPIRLVVKLRRLAVWLAEENEQWLHGESDLKGDDYGQWLHTFAGSDCLLRWLYPFQGCIWGAKGCDASVPYGKAIVLCEACSRG